MKVKILLIFALLGAVFVSLTVGTLSSYNATSSFGASVTAKEKGAWVKKQAELEKKSYGAGQDDLEEASLKTEGKSDIEENLGSGANDDAAPGQDISSQGHRIEDIQNN